MSSHPECLFCRRPQGQYSCGLCSEPICRSCAIFLPEDAFFYRTSVAPEFKHLNYCPPCHEATVQPELDAYAEQLAQAKEVYFFFDTRKQAMPFIEKAKVQVSVPSCVDRDETILRLGFMAVEQGYNAILDADVAAEKKRDHGWQKTQWRGKGWPAQVDAEKLERRSERRGGG